MSVTQYKPSSSKSVGTTSAAISELLSTIIISPREAEKLTWELAVGEAGRDKVDIAPSLSLELHYLKAGQAPYWYVHYWAVSKDQPPYIIDRLGFRYSSAFQVDAATGEIIEKDAGEPFGEHYVDMPTPGFP